MMTTFDLVDNLQNHFPDITDVGFVIDEALDVHVHNSDADPDTLAGMIMRLYYSAADQEKGVKYFINQYHGGKYLYFTRLNGNIWLFLISESEAFSKLHFYLKFLLPENESLESGKSGTSRAPSSDKFASAKRIQEMLFQHPGQFLNDERCFLWHRPKDKIGGDYYWSKQTKDATWVIIGDCTGHSVEGALATVSVLSVINQIFDDGMAPHQLIKQLHTSLANMQNQKLAEGYGIGNEMIVLKYYRHLNELHYSGIGLPLYLIGARLRAFKTKSAHFEPERVLRFLRSRRLLVKPGTTIFTHSDGLTDQLNDSGKKMGRKRLTDLLSSGSLLTSNSIAQTFHSWRGQTEQTDDIIAFGFMVQIKKPL